MPSAVYSATDYLNTLCELESFIDSNPCDGVCIAGDFNLDFGRGGSHVNLLDDFVLELDLVVCDLSFASSVNYTYERDDGLVRSWIDHVVCSKLYLSPLVSDIHISLTDIVVSDHYPLFFHFDIQYSSLSFPSSHTSACNLIHRIDWSKVSSDNIRCLQVYGMFEIVGIPS